MTAQVIARCVGQPPEFWDTGDPGNRLALQLCAVCPARRDENCLVGEPDRKPFGVIRAGVAYNERGGRCPTCDCGYPVDDLPDARRQLTGCRHCRVPKLRSWDSTFMNRQAYQAKRWQTRKAKAKAAA
ncbi:hypothetical protein [Micromonospora sp. NPDC005299]|uniref:hypothetical protein n=1 Tax=Micromonospora sp. NPDC005299 TaxID=3364231 RepID=UPI003686B196